MTLPITDPVLIFALVLVIILVIPLLFARIRVPGIVGLILAGVVIGPNALNLLARDATIVLLGTVGLLYIMFVAGLEIDLNRFHKYRSHSLVFGALTFFIPQIGGTLMAVYVLGFGLAPAVLLASMFASHTLVAYPIASRFGITRNTAVTAAIGGTIITDTAALLVLAIILAVERGVIGPGFWITLTVSLSVYTVVVFWGLPRLGRWFFRTVSEGTSAFLFVLAAVFASAYLSQVAGVEPIIGAFLAGLALNRLIPSQGALMNRVLFVGHALFIPFFLISVGMLVDLRALFAGVGALLIPVSMVVTVIVAKWLATQGARLLLGYSREEAGVMYGLSVAQAAATLAVVLIAFEVGVFGAFGEAVLNGAILMMLVTCIMAPLLTEHFGRAVARQDEQKPFEPSELPQRTLVPLANPSTAPSLLDLAFLVHAPGSDEPVFVLTVARDGDDVRPQVAASEKLLSHAVIHGAAADYRVIPVTRIDMNVANGIVRAIRENGISNIIIGWTGQVSASERIFGSVLDQLLQSTREMIMVCKLDHPLNTTGRVVAAVPPFIEREPGFAGALRSIKIMADQLGAALHILSTEEMIPILKTMASEIKPDIPTAYSSVSGLARVAHALNSVTRRGDMIVLFSAREQTIAWRPGLNRLPRLVAARLDLANLIVVYPAELPMQGHLPGEQLISSEPVRGLRNRSRIVLDVKGPTRRDVIEQVVGGALGPDRIMNESLIVELVGNSPDDSTEIIPGVMLFHAHTAMHDDQMLCLGISREGVMMPGRGGPVHVFVVLLSAANLPPEQHLSTLAEIARLVSAPGLVDGFRKARSTTEVERLLGLTHRM